MPSTSAPPSEARLLESSYVLISLNNPDGAPPVEGFFGAVCTDPAELPELAGKTVYLCGDLSGVAALDLSRAARVRVIRGHARGDEDGGDGAWPRVDLAELPLRVHGVGVLFRRFFDPEGDFFHRVQREHSFQSLTESNKPGRAHRTGIYLSPVHREGDALRFRLLRCSTNLSGPTESFRATDRHIVDALNQEAAQLFEGAAPLNHVLAQIYHNTPANAEKKQAKARISLHADKTKDMPGDGIMAFCTFYDHPVSQDPPPGDEGPSSGLTTLRFRLKEEATPGPLPAQFTVTLHPNSVFFMPLSTNRLYTHEIRPAELDAAKLPTRLGYVVRCSKTEAVHEDGRTFLLRDGQRIPLEDPTPEGMAELREVYAQENRSSGFIDYGDRFRFSMNQGDYLAPGYSAADELRVYTLRVPDGLFAELLTSARFEDVGKGRRGAVLVATDDPRGVPIVRTTTPYTHPAQAFRPVHARLERQVRACASLPRALNNALIEVYTSAYTRMGAHSDQAQDLEDASEIAIFSCYDQPDSPSRRLVVESKEPGGPSFEVPLAHGSVVVFSTDTNRRFRHRIVPAAGDAVWLGLTFRSSKTFVRFVEGHARLADGTPLRLASEEERGQLLELRRRENHEVDFTYPPLSYTLSASDLAPPEPAG